MSGESRERELVEEVDMLKGHFLPWKGEVYRIQ